MAKTGKSPTKIWLRYKNISEIHPTLGFTEFDILEKIPPDSGFCAVRPVRLDRSVKAFVDFRFFSCSEKQNLLFFFTDRRNSSLRSSDTTGRAFGNPNRILVPAPMVFRHKTLHLTLTRPGKGIIRKIL